MKLKEILAEITCREVKGEGDPEITGVAYDSREVKPSALFVAIRGYRADGHDFLAEAVARGAAAVIVEETSPEAAGVPQIIVEETRPALAAAAAAFFGHPGRELAVAGVTGTSGKTTVCYLLDSMLRAAGAKTALATTVKNVVGGKERPARLTTGEAPEVQALLREAAGAGGAYVVLEVSSHALTLSRVEGIPFAAAVFTNLSHDHLDLHGDMEGYFAAKASLFSRRRDGAPAVVNADDPYGRKLASSLPGRVVTYGESEEAKDYRLANVSAGRQGLAFTISGPDGSRVDLSSPQRGAFDASNGAAAYAAAREMGVGAEAARRGMAEAPPVPGRLELVEAHDNLRVVIDYAHAPDSMAKALAEIRAWAPGRLVVVFGCTGDRDREKRPEMAAIAGRYGDYVVLTSDDPYYEDPAAIAREAEAGLIAAGASEPEDYRIVLDRGEALRLALASARAEEPTVVAILGKGHEEVQKVKGRSLPFNDRATVEALLTELGLRDAAPAPRGP